MKAPQFVYVFLAGCVFLAAQPQTNVVVGHSKNIALNVEVLKQSYKVGEEPVAVLTVENSGPRTIELRTYRVYVEGEKGEPPTTLRQRQITSRLHPGEPALADSMFAGPYVEPSGSNFVGINLSLLYDLSKPGKYRVYVVMQDEAASTSTSVRSTTVEFEVRAGQ
jgi:hypothetical protein